MALKEDKTRLAVDVNDRDHAIGSSAAPVTLVEYGDYECPDCGNAYPTVKRLIAELGSSLRFVFRNFPQNSIHAHAGVAAQAAEAAAAQGKFWEMHDLLYEHQQDLDEWEIGQFALKAGLEIYRFEADLSSERFAQRVDEDFQSGVRSGVKGTPTFFINGVRHQGKWDFESLRSALMAAM